MDNRPQPRYPFEFHQGDALEFLRAHGREFDAIHASPPCQRFSKMTRRHGRQGEHPDLIEPTRALLDASGRPWVMENVSGAPLSGFSAVLCGTMFGLKVFRHRLFESSHLLLAPDHPRHDGTTNARSNRPGKGYHGGEGGYVTVSGRTCSPALAREAMGIDWMVGRELAQAIPPAYTEYIGKQLLNVLA